MEIAATATFMRNIADQLDDLAFWELQDFVLEHPELGKRIPGGRGLRKLRWNASGRGKRGGMRVIYYYKVGESFCSLRPI